MKNKILILLYIIIVGFICIYCCRNIYNIVYPNKTNSDTFIYSDKSKTEIIGITDEGQEVLDLVFPEKVKKISNIYIKPNSMIQTVRFKNKNVELENVSFSCSSITTVFNLPNTMTEIPTNMFNNCKYLTTMGEYNNTIDIPDNIKVIGENAFSDCGSITSIKLNNVETIKEYAFQDCKKLTNIEWGTSLINIGDGAFAHTDLKTLKLPDTVRELGSMVFLNCTNLERLDISNVETIGQNLCKNCRLINTFIAKNDFDAIKVSSESSDYTTIFDYGKVVNLYIKENSAYYEYLQNNPNKNFTIYK